MAFNLNRAYSWAINTCNAPKIGYSQSYRNQRVVNGVTYYDCSSFINYALIAGGASTPSYAPDHNAFTTYTMGVELLRLGFSQLKVGDSFEWKAGDIGVSNTHTEMCYKGGKGKAIFMGAHTSKATLTNQVSIGSSSGDASYERTFPSCFRYGDGGASGSGYSAYVVAAMCGNFWTESNVNPGIWESTKAGTWTDLNKGYGLGQWTNTGGDTHGRLYQLHEWLSSNNYADYDMEGQLKYIEHENVWHKGTSYQQAITYDTLSDFLNSSSTDIDELTKAWMYCWEGINNGTLSQRQEQAREAYNYIIAHANDSSITTYYHSNNYLTKSQILNNCVMVYRLIGGSGGGGGTGFKRKGMPVWMMVRYF